MKTIIVLAMHGVPPNDFPRNEMAELLALHGRLGHAVESERISLERRYAEIDAKIRAWPRTVRNDPFYMASQDLAEHLSQATGCEVIVGFNEFCAPSLDEAIDDAMLQRPDKVIVLTTMMTRGGEHSEVHIPQAIRRAQGKYPGIPIVYVWPFEVSEVAQFLATQVARFTKGA